MPTTIVQMKTKMLILAATIVSAAIVMPTTMNQEFTPDSNQQIHSFTKTITRTVSLNYLLFVPQAAKSDPNKKWPLMLFLHGAGERGTNLWLVTKHGPPKIVREKPDFPFILVSPQCPQGETWSADSLIALLDDVIGRLPVDKSRVYLTGLSMGGYGTWNLATWHPERFAAVVPICGGGDPVGVVLADGPRAAALKTLAVWAFHGAKDPVVSIDESRRMVEAFKRVGCQEIDLTVYPEAGHDSWTETYNNPKLYEWLLKHKR